MSEKKEAKNVPAIVEDKGNGEVAKSENIGIKNYDLTQSLPDINGKLAKALPIDLMSDYWTPEEIGEQKRVFFSKIGMRKVLDQNSGEILDLESAFFIEQKEDGELVQISNGSKRLVGAIAAAEIKAGTPLLIMYKGKKRNKSNAYSSDDWSVKPIIVNIG